MDTDKKIGIFGMGISGTSCLSFLKPMAKEIICWDDSENNRSKIEDKYLLPLSNGTWQELDIIIISPGIPHSHEVFLLANKHNILISSDIEIFMQINYDSEIIAITGTNGKSTVTALISHVLKENKLDYHMGGNIGLPVLSLPQHAKGYVLELSSFQLDLLKKINPTIAILLNITPDHLDRYSTYEEYIKSKEKILMGDGIKIIGTNSNESKTLYNNIKIKGEPRLIPLQMKSEQLGIFCDKITITDNFFDYQKYHLPDIRSLQGAHNFENMAAAFAACRALGVNANSIIKSFESFKGLDHRMQFVGLYKNISFYNDSKATNTSSAVSSLSAFDNIFWLAGGIFKEKNLLAIKQCLKNIKKAYLFGKSKLLFAEYLEGKIDYVICENMEEAFNIAVNDAEKQVVEANILLAPACSSLDQFKNFEDRGFNFINLYNARFSKK